MKEKKLITFFFRKKPVLMLIQLAKKDRIKYVSVLAKQVDCTYSHTVRILQELQRARLVQFEKKGRLKIVSLSKEGEEIASLLENLYKRFEKLEKS
ncbi:MAG: winged helix DNA-binding protein [Candidatus Parvarchaeota archaeon]|nr:winged helix DNA-binding protein [Candidatus Jingweiarchaeum tengchongense]MCW1298019.1 winged helix DNA-binding protein [Candidatus Jingweiarchaeum tengchongense]MCW1300181.1 winged helix DNA-binding protein [Candidatus Jingweiarchaeum tengchongense]MCW1304391.1 winged helix DNA-binding protein [Candidatus Jingweiarchaeum tengchongense]MCW1310943.1 winged helix DNA-binding protein [Candidatus Jingweiarchaeum tengchongense]